MQSSNDRIILDRKKFEELFREHFVHLCNFAGQYVSDHDAAKDITQKVFINLWENRDKIDVRQSVISYLFTSVKNRSLNYLRDHKKYRSRILDLDCSDVELSIPEESMEMEDLRRRIRATLDLLPEKCRVVFEMSRYEDKKYREIAEELNISQKTVEAHMSKAIKSLREQLKEYIHLLWIVTIIDIFIWVVMETKGKTVLKCI